MISERLDHEMRIQVSKSKVYGLLKRLLNEEWLHKYYDKEAQAHRYTTRFRGPYITKDKFDEEFLETKLIGNH
jgi:hypothetical protein